MRALPGIALGAGARQKTTQVAEPGWGTHPGPGGRLSSASAAAAKAIAGMVRAVGFASWPCSLQIHLQIPGDTVPCRDNPRLRGDEVR